MVGTLPASTDVFVAGGGPAGLATAIAARRRGLNVLVVDGALPPIDKPCGEGLMPDGVQALRDLGINLLADSVYPFRGIRFLSESWKAEARFPYGTAYGVRRTDLHLIMLEHAAAVGVRMVWQAAVSGLHPEGALVGGKLVRARWIVGADGTSSRVRHWAHLDQHRRKKMRFAFRRHYRVKPHTDFMELYWGRDCQIYVTPVGTQEICVVAISQDPRLRLDAALAAFPELSARLHGATHASTEQGAITVSRTLHRVFRDRTVLVGDASGGVDAITGEGLCLAFKQAAILADCLASGDLSPYQSEHRKLARRPALMSRLMLLMARSASLRRKTMLAFRAEPRLFAGLLSMHVGAGSTLDYLSNGVAMGLRILKLRSQET
jgi:menaquinone-9 beta-reductase